MCNGGEGDGCGVGLVDCYCFVIVEGTDLAVGDERFGLF